MFGGSIPLRRRLFISVCAFTRTTEFAARRIGVAPFLPALFTLRYANMGGLDRDKFAAELGRLRSFRDARWCEFWDSIAAEHLNDAQVALETLAAGDPPQIREFLFSGHPEVAERVADLVAPATAVFGDHGPQRSRESIEDLVQSQSSGSDAQRTTAAFVALDELVKAATYFQVSAFPGGSPGRMRSYSLSRRLTDLLVNSFRSGLDIDVGTFEVVAGGETVKGYVVFPNSDAPAPAVLVTNGLEGTVQELLIPNLRYRDNGLAMFVMEMPGTYAYENPMSGRSEQIYDAVISEMVRDPRIDATRLAMVGVSFGGYWSTRMAASNRQLRCAVVCGAPTHRSFGPTGSLGIPQIIIDALADVTGSGNPITLSRRLHALSLRDRYAGIPIPLLVINGDSDTLLSTQDSIDLAETAPHGELKLYENDDHCAMGHYREWLDLCQQWLCDRLLGALRI